MQRRSYVAGTGLSEAAVVRLSDPTVRMKTRTPLVEDQDALSVPAERILSIPSRRLCEKADLHPQLGPPVLNLPVFNLFHRGRRACKWMMNRVLTREKKSTVFAALMIRLILTNPEVIADR